MNLFWGYDKIDWYVNEVIKLENRMIKKAQKKILL